MTSRITLFPRIIAARGLGMAIRGAERLLISLRSAYRGLTGREAPVRPMNEKAAYAPRPAVPIEMSITPDYIVCLEDGRRFKMLKGHLRASFGMSPEDYRAKWGLPTDYPMVAPRYREKRIRMAKDMGLGHMRKAKPRRKAKKAEPAGSNKRAA